MAAFKLFDQNIIKTDINLQHIGNMDVMDVFKFVNFETIEKAYKNL